MTSEMNMLRAIFATHIWKYGIVGCTILIIGWSGIVHAQDSTAATDNVDSGVPVAANIDPKSAVTAKQQQEGKLVILAIGINDYQYLSRMRSCVNNAKLIAELFRNGKTTEVTLLLDQQATKANILDTLKNYKRQLTSQDKLLIYYSGQGGQNSVQWQNVVRDAGPQYSWRDENVYDETIMPVDASYRRDSQLTSDELGTVLKTLPLKQIIIVTDTCYSRVMVQSVSPSFNRVKEVRRPRLSVRDLSMYGYNIIAASDWNETPWDDILDGQPQGIFTHYLVQGVQSKAAETKADGKLTVNELYEYARSMTVQYIGVQHPQLYRGRDPECVVWEYEESGK